MECCRHVWAGAPNCYLDYGTICLSLAASLEPLIHRRNVASLNFFYWYYFSRWSNELAELIPLPYSCGQSNRYSNSTAQKMKFSVQIY